MAIIKTSETSTWSTARWIYENLLEGALSNLAVDDKLHEKLESSLYDGSFFLDLTRYSQLEKEKFADLVSSVLEQTLNNGPASFESPDFYDGYIVKLSELKIVLEKG